MTSLVSYGVGSSDESEGSDNEDESLTASKVIPQLQDSRSPSSVPQKSSLFSSLPKPISSSQEGLSSPHQQKSSFSANIPKPNSATSDHDQPATSEDVSATGPEKSSLFSTLPEPKSKSHSASFDASVSIPSLSAKQSVSGGQKKPALFSSLPSPKKQAVLTEEKDPSSAVQDTATKGFLNLPEPKKRQPVKISLPALPDPDSDEDEPEEKKPRQTKGAGLFSLLPKPKTASRKEANRAFIPYTLTKKPTTSHLQPSQSPAKTPPQSTLKSGSTGGNPQHPTAPNYLVTAYSDDEGDEEEEESKERTKGKVNFFSMEDYEKEKEAQKTKTCSPPRKVEDISGQNQSSLVAQSDGAATERTSGYSEELTPPAVPATQDQPLVFNPSRVAGPTYPGSQNFPYGPTASEIEPSGPRYGPSVSEYGPNAGYSQSYDLQYYQTDPSGQYNVQDTAGATGYQEMDEVSSSSGTSAGGSGDAMGQQNFMQDEQFVRMVGKKNRGREEIQIIDINADDQIGPTTGLQQMVKSMTEEKEYRGKLKKEQLPTSQQKRKHQITFLAHQAKERELALKNQWADNRLTRKQTQAKYGF